MCPTIERVLISKHQKQTNTHQLRTKPNQTNQHNQIQPKRQMDPFFLHCLLGETVAISSIPHFLSISPVPISFFFCSFCPQPFFYPVFPPFPLLLVMSVRSVRHGLCLVVYVFHFVRVDHGRPMNSQKADPSNPFSLFPIRSTTQSFYPLLDTQSLVIFLLPSRLLCPPSPFFFSLRYTY